MIASVSPHVMGSSGTIALSKVRPQRILQVVSHTDPRYGGMSSTVPELMARLDEKGVCGHEIEIRLAAFCSPKEYVLPPRLQAEQVDFWPVGRKAWVRNASMSKQFEEELRRSDALHIHGLWEQSTALSARLARQAGVPYVMSAHGMLEPWALVNKRFKKMLYSFFVERANVASASCLHALTLAEERQYRKFGATAPIVVIPNAIDVPSSAHASDFLDCFPELRGKRLILFLSRLHSKKGADLILRAWSTIAGSFPDSHLVLAGPDSEGTKAKLQLFVQSFGLGHSVSFPGMLSGPAKWGAFAAATAFVLPSQSEGMPVSALEAMAMGVPVIVTKACNLPTVSQYKAGWEVEVNVSSLQTALLECLQNTPETNQLIGRRGKQLTTERYSWPVILQQFHELYNWLLAGASPDNIPSSLSASFADRSRSRR
jgi:glycosyltransferase involved in cell wall biosynthesis